MVHLWHPGAPPPPAGDRDLVIYDGADVPPYATLLGSPENWGDEIADRPVVEHATVKVETDGDAKRVTWNGTGAGQFYAQDDSPGTYLRPYLLGGGALQFDTVISRAPEAPTTLRIDCVYPCLGSVQATELFRQLPLNTRTTVKIPLECFAETGADFAQVNTPFLVYTEGAFTASFANIRWVPGRRRRPRRQELRQPQIALNGDSARRRLRRAALDARAGWSAMAIAAVAVVAMLTACPAHAAGSGPPTGGGAARGAEPAFGGGGGRRPRDAIVTGAGRAAGLRAWSRSPRS